jgi:hypothetical protein
VADEEPRPAATISDCVVVAALMRAAMAEVMARAEARIELEGRS